MNIEEINTIRAEWQAALPTFTDLQWLEILPEGKTILKLKLQEDISELEEAQKEIQLKVREWRNRKNSDSDPLGAMLVLEKLDQDKLEIEKQVKRCWWLLQSVKRFRDGEVLLNAAGITTADIEQAKLVPIENFYIGKLRKFGTRAVGNCEFHNEKGPSFTIYLKQNTYYCYGCGKGGDVISYIMLKEELTFLNAVKKLINK